MRDFYLISLKNDKSDDKYSIQLEKFPTKDIEDSHINGELTVVWRDWDNIIKKYPKMVYISSVNPWEKKGPHIHTERDSHFTCIHGKVVFIIKNTDGTYTEIISSDKNPTMVFVPKKVPSAHINLSDKISKVLALADIAWKPNDNETKDIDFEDYNWEKWNNSIGNS